MFHKLTNCDRIEINIARQISFKRDETSAEIRYE